MLTNYLVVGLYDEGRFDVDTCVCNSLSLGDSMKTGVNVWIGGDLYRKVQEVIALYEKLDKRVTTKDIVHEALKQYLPKVKEALDMKIREEATKKDRVWQALFGRENLKW